MVILNFRALNFKPLLEMANPISIDSFLQTQILSKETLTPSPLHQYVREFLYIKKFGKGDCNMTYHFLHTELNRCAGLGSLHWCIKSIYNRCAIDRDCTLKVVPFCFCHVQVMPLFIIFFWLLGRSDKSSAFSSSLQQQFASFWGFRHIWGWSIYLIATAARAAP